MSRILLITWFVSLYRCTQSLFKGLFLPYLKHDESFGDWSIQTGSDVGANHRCFDDCINDFTSKAVSTKEETCISRCVDKFIKASERTGQRFAEHNQAMAQGGGAGIGGR